VKVSRKNIFIAAALALWAAPVFAAPGYNEAAGRWTAEQALRLPKAITPAYLKEVETSVGAREAAVLAEKKAKVSALLERYKTCALGAEDLKTAEKYFTEEFKGEIGYFVNGGCAAFRGAAAGQVSAPKADISDIENFAASGQFATLEGSAGFFDGASARKGTVPAVAAGGYAARPAAAAAAPVTAPAAKKPLSARVPMPAAMREAMTPPARPADLGQDGMVHKAMAYWLEMRRENWSALKGGELKGSAKAKAAGKLAAGAVLHGLLWMSNLENVETAAARLGWDAGSGAGAAVITADAAKLVFHSAVFVLMLAPIPLTKVAKAALAGEPWAVAFVGAMAAGPINRYWLHFAD
jgi:hypothetical protein